MDESIRINVAAVILRDDAVLLVRFDDESGPHYNLPGGGVETGETFHDALHREVLEECAAQVTIGSLLAVGEYVPARADFVYGTRHKVALVFQCTLLEGSEPRLPDHPDPHQVGVEWVPLRDLPTAPLIPEIARQLLANLAHPESRSVQPVDVIAWV